ncbi:MAG: CstA-like transporter-associated (seleno)protein [Alphaproteobacteria bacterium]
MLKILQKIFNKIILFGIFFRNFLNYINGDFAYENYLQNNRQHQCNKDSCSNKILTKKQFLRQKIHEKYNKISRCC